MSCFLPHPARRLAALTFVTALALAPAIAAALPMNFGTVGDNKPITARWPDNATIHVYIPTPPDPPGACGLADAKAGITRWQAALAQRGITVQFHDNASPPPGATNAVGVQWVPDGTLPDDNDGYGEARATDQPGGAVINGGTIKVETDAACGDYLRNLFMHEFGHVLGLDDDATMPGMPHNAMDHDVSDDAPMGFSARDSSEMKSLYGCFAVVPPATPKGGLNQSVTPIGDPPTGFHYAYSLEWYAGPGIVTFDLSLGVARGLVTVLEMPPGWEVATAPFYRDGMAEPTVTEETRELHFYTRGDGLSAAMPVGNFLLHSTAAPGPGWALPLVDPDDNGLFDAQPATVPTIMTGGVAPQTPAPGGSLHWLPPHPNPFRDRVTLRFTVGAPWREGRVEIFDVHGRLLRSIDPGRPRSGEIEVAWDGCTREGETAGPGAYFARVTLDGASASGVLLRTR